MPLTAALGVALGGALLAPADRVAGAQQAPAVRPALPATTDRWSLDAEYLHLGAAPIARRAGASMGVALGYALGRAGGGSDAPGPWRVEAGWLRAARVRSTAQGATLGVSRGVRVGRPDADGRTRLALRPGVAVLAGWAEWQGGGETYLWRGLPNTPYAGQTGTASDLAPARARATGAGAALGADLRLTRGLALAGSVRGWAFAGDAAQPNRRVTLAGAGLTVRPYALAADARRWWHALGGPQASVSQTGAQQAGTQQAAEGGR